ncbi:unnamed protein product, partial [Phaeothamnion confervicola]
YPVARLGAGPATLRELVDGKLGFSEKLKTAKHPLIVVGMGALAREDGAAILALARDLAEKLNAVRADWNGFAVLHTTAARVGGLDLGLVPGDGGRDVEGILAGCEKREIELVYLLAADEIDTKRLGKAFVVYQGHHGDVGAHRADVVLPGAAYTEKPGTYVNTEGRVQLGQRAGYPPGDAREDWAILRALSERLGKTLPYDTLDQVRARLVAVNKTFAAIDQQTAGTWGVFGKAGTLTDQPFAIVILAQCLAVTVPLLVAVAYMTYVDRKVWASIQLRRGPNVVGPFGLLQPFADGLKLVLKETIVPSSANAILFIIAPMITFITALVAWAVVPFDDGWVIANINVGILYLFAISSLGVYGIIIAGWASNSKYAFLGALRSAAQMVSYEVSIGFVLITVLLCVGSLNLSDVVLAQSGGFWHWFFLPLLPMFVIFFVSALAETNRTPFDLPMSEAELVAGFHTEYSAMTFGLFFLGEYANMILLSALGAILFLGGWMSPIPYAPFTYVPGVVWFALKIAFLLFVFSWTKGTLPRYRYDQLMRLGWKVFLPVSLGWVVLTAAVLQFGGWVPKL